jgi:hypothetical protein
MRAIGSSLRKSGRIKVANLAAPITALPSPVEPMLPATMIRSIISSNVFVTNIRSFHVPTPAYRPELHELAERWNLTVMKMTNAMLFSARLSHILWPSAVAHANLLRNRLPIRGLGKYTPYELFFGERPRIDQLRVFGCDCYKLLPTYPKLPGQSARKRLIYCGETADRVGYRVFDPVTYKFSTEFELTFDEHSARKRINSLYEYDARRDLQKVGKLSKLPVIGDDFAKRDIAQEAVRNIFSPPSTSPRTSRRPPPPPSWAP